MSSGNAFQLSSDQTKGLLGINYGGINYGGGE